VLDTVRTVEDVGTLGDYVLMVPDIKREELARQCAGDEEIRERLVHYFLETSPYASWEWLGGQLQYHGYGAAVQAAKVHIKPEKGM
jgi:hypothetical protein